MKKSKLLIRDIMVKNVVTVSPETSILEAADRLTRTGFTGVPVIDKKRKVIGIVTEYDLLTKGTAIHLPAFLKIFGEFLVFNGRNGGDKKQVKSILAFTVKDVMNPEPLVLRESEALDDLIRTFSEHHRVNPIPVVNNSGILTGIISRFDVVKFYAGLLNRASSGKKKT